MPTENIPTAIEWMNAHPADYRRLFDDGALTHDAFEALLQSPTIQPERIALSALARYNNVRRRLHHSQSQLIHYNVKRILYTAQEGGLGQAHEFLHDFSVNELSRLTAMTAQLIFAWQRGCMQYRLASPFRNLYDEIELPIIDVREQPVRLVLMGAAALRFIGEPLPAASNIVPPRVKEISTYGPQYYFRRLHGHNKSRPLPERTVITAQRESRRFSNLE